MAIEFYRDGEAAVAFDDRYFPILCVTWTGAATISLAERHTDWVSAQIARARLHKTKVILAVDATKAGRPGPEVRERFSEQLDPTALVFVATYVALTSRLVRGAITAVRWLAGDYNFNVTPTQTMREALERSLVHLDELKIARPPRLDIGDYKTPTLARASRAC